MLKKNLFKKITSAVLAMCFCICSVGSVCLASNHKKTSNHKKQVTQKKKRLKLKKQSSINIPPPSVIGQEYKREYDILNKRTDFCEYDCEEEEKNNLNDNNNPSANAEESGTQDGNETPQSTVSGYSESWHEIVFGDDNDE